MIGFDFTNLGFDMTLDTPYILNIQSYGQGFVNEKDELLNGILYDKVIRTRGTNGSGGNTGGTIGREGERKRCSFVALGKCYHILVLSL